MGRRLLHAYTDRVPTVVWEDLRPNWSHRQSFLAFRASAFMFPIDRAVLQYHDILYWLFALRSGPGRSKSTEDDAHFR